jgi:hypothetical protein
MATRILVVFFPRRAFLQCTYVLPLDILVFPQLRVRDCGIHLPFVARVCVGSASPVKGSPIFSVLPRANTLVVRLDLTVYLILNVLVRRVLLGS